MNKLIKFATGNAPKLPIACRINNLQTPAIPTSAVVQASITSLDKTVLIAPVAVPESNTGSDWANRVVNVQFSSAQTSITIASESIEAILEIEIDESGDPLTWFVPIIIEQGTI